MVPRPDPEAFSGGAPREDDCRSRPAHGSAVWGSAIRSATTARERGRATCRTSYARSFTGQAVVLHGSYGTVSFKVKVCRRLFREDVGMAADPGQGCAATSRSRIRTVCGGSSGLTRDVTSTEVSGGVDLIRSDGRPRSGVPPRKDVRPGEHGRERRCRRCPFIPEFKAKVDAGRRDGLTRDERDGLAALRRETAGFRKAWSSSSEPRPSRRAPSFTSGPAERTACIARPIRNAGRRACTADDGRRQGSPPLGPPPGPASTSTGPVNAEQAHHIRMTLTTSGVALLADGIQGGRARRTPAVFRRPPPLLPRHHRRSSYGPRPGGNSPYP